MSGLYVASNTKALGAQTQLQRNTQNLSDILTRLSTGLRINSGKDDPAGLIASELLKSDISATKMAIQNTARANSILAVADSALGQISSLLNDIRGLVNQSANTGAMNDDQIAANQLQVDASIDSIDRIAKTTNFQGKLILNGDMDFTTRGLNAYGQELENLQIHSANFGSQDQVDVSVAVHRLGEKAALIYEKTGVSQDTLIEIGGSLGREMVSFAAGTSVADMATQINQFTDATGVRAYAGLEATHGQILITSAGLNNDINFIAKDAGFDAGNYAIKFTAGSADGPKVVITDPVAGKSGVIDIQLQTQAASAASGVIDESNLGITTTNFLMNDCGNGCTASLSITSTNGQKVQRINFIQSSGIPGSMNTNTRLDVNNRVAVDLDKDGTLHVQYLYAPADCADGISASVQDLINAINKMSGLKADLVGTGTDVYNTACCIGGGMSAVDPTRLLTMGYQSGVNQRTNNSIQLTATSTGAAMNDTDVVYINAQKLSTGCGVSAGCSPCVNVSLLKEAQKAAITAYSMDASSDTTAGCLATIMVTANDAGSKWNGVKVLFLQDDSIAAKARASYDADSRTLTIAGNGQCTTADEVQAAVAATGIFSAVVLQGDDNFDFSIMDGRTAYLGSVNGDLINEAGSTDSACAAVGTAYIKSGKTGGDIGDIVITKYVTDAGGACCNSAVVTAFYDAATYVSTAQRASITIEDRGLHVIAPGGAACSQCSSNYVTFTATRATSDINDLRIKIENVDGSCSGNEKYAGNVFATYNAASKELHIIGDLANATYSQMMEAVAKATDNEITVAVSTNINGSGAVATGSQKIGLGMVTDDQPFRMGTKNGFDYFTPSLSEAGSQVVGGRVGTDHGAILVNAVTDLNPDSDLNMSTTAADVVRAINNDSSNSFFSANSVDSDGSGRVFEQTDADGVRAFVAALQGGNDGYASAMTADELIEFINNHEELSKLFYAERANGNDGRGLVTFFQEFAEYGDPNAETGLQFLGPKDSADISFVIDRDKNGKAIANSELRVTWEGESSIRPDATLTADYANAAFTVTANQSGELFRDVAVQFVRMDKETAAVKGNYAVFEEGPSRSVAYCSINEEKTGTEEELGKFIITANAKGDAYDNVAVKAQINRSQGEKAVAAYDAATKTLMITVNDTSVTLSEAFAAIEAEGTFTADYDYSFNTKPHDNPGMNTFESLLSGAQNFNPKTIGNTGTTGSHTGGVITVYLGGDHITAEDAMKAINESVSTRDYFNATRMQGSDGTGFINFRADTLTQKPDDCDMVTDYRMVLDLSGDCPTVTEPKMVVHLATDQYGNSITTARDLVEYFDTLTPEQTHGISVSLIRPTGVNNVTDLDCVDDFGRGILQETGWYDDCYNLIENNIVFQSANQDTVIDKAYGQVAAVNGKSASYTVTAKNAGPEYNGVSIRYTNIAGKDQESRAEYDAENKTINVYIDEGKTTAYQVKEMIEKTGLFTVTLADGSGLGLVMTSDNALSLSGGVHTTGEAGGAYLRDNYDEDPHGLILESTVEGTSQKVTVRVLKGDFVTKDAATGLVSESATGSDAVISVNGQKATTDGNEFSVNNSMLSVSGKIAEGMQEGDTSYFSIVGGGATFQLGPDVVTNQQIRISLPNVNSSTLGGLSGMLYQLRSGEGADLSTDTKLADKIVQEAISAITVARGRIGAIQKSTLEPNQAVLEDTVEQLSAAEALISNADFAEESSKLTRAQILMQSGTQVLALANQFPQYAAQLVGG